MFDALKEKIKDVHNKQFLNSGAYAVIIDYVKHDVILAI